jgi:bacteriocin-like protein
MNSQTEQVAKNELSEAELDQVNGGMSFIDFADALLSAFVGTDGHGNGPIKHFMGNGGHYKS